MQKFKDIKTYSDNQNLDQLMNLRYTFHNCQGCKFYRYCETGCWTSECILLGRTLAIGDQCFVYECNGNRICDGWKRRPKKWNIHCIGTKENPHWFDKYIKREELINKRNKIYKRRNKKFNVKYQRGGEEV